MLETIIHNILAVCHEQPNVNTAAAGSIYEVMNTQPDLEYGVTVLFQNTHTEDNGFLTYSFTLFYVDRLKSDKSNEYEIMSNGIAVMRNVILTLEEEYDWDISDNRSYNTFTERFADECAGVFTTIEITVQIEDICAELF